MSIQIPNGVKIPKSALSHQLDRYSIILRHVDTVS